MSNQISTYRKLNLPLPRSIYLVFLPLEMQRRLKQSKVYHMFFYCLKRYNPESFKSGRSKNPFLQCVCYWYNLLRWMFSILCGNWKTLLFIKIYHYSEIVLTAMFLLVFWRKSVLYSLSQRKFQSKADYAS